jgi:hypothetical protein
VVHKVVQEHRDDNYVLLALFVIRSHRIIDKVPLHKYIEVSMNQFVSGAMKKKFTWKHKNSVVVCEIQVVPSILFICRYLATSRL